ncbi:hypothetical protein BH23PLA1_BH23PLA1_09200 [soil metagenome]
MTTATATRAATACPSPGSHPRPVQIDFPGFEIAEGETVVDVGCGVGDVCVYAGHRGAHVVGLDIEDLLVDRAHEAMRDVPARSFRGIVSNCDPIPLPDASADVIVCTEVLEHVEDPSKFLAELARIGKPGARYLISVPHPTSEAVMRRIAPDWYFRHPFHVHVYEPERLDALLIASGLEVLGRHDSGFYWSMSWFLKMTVGMADPYILPEHPMIDAWDTVASHLAEHARGHDVLRALDLLVPKSQVRIARKVGGRSLVRISDQPSRLKRWLRDGSIQIGGLDLRWSLRRSNPRRSDPAPPLDP